MFTMERAPSPAATEESSTNIAAPANTSNSSGSTATPTNPVTQPTRHGDQKLRVSDVPIDHEPSQTEAESALARHAPVPRSLVKQTEVLEIEENDGTWYVTGEVIVENGGEAAPRSMRTGADPSPGTDGRFQSVGDDTYRFNPDKHGSTQSRDSATATAETPEPPSEPAASIVA